MYVCTFLRLKFYIICESYKINHTKIILKPLLSRGKYEPSVTPNSKGITVIHPTMVIPTGVRSEHTNLFRPYQYTHKPFNKVTRVGQPSPINPHFLLQGSIKS